MSTCWQTHNIVPHTSLHDPPNQKTVKECEDFGEMEVAPSAEIRDSNMVL